MCFEIVQGEHGFTDAPPTFFQTFIQTLIERLESEGSLGRNSGLTSLERKVGGLRRIAKCFGCESKSLSAVRLFPRDVSLEHGLPIVPSRVRDRFVTDLANGLREYRENRVRSAIAIGAADVGLESADHDEDLVPSIPGCRSGAARTSPGRSAFLVHTDDRVERGWRLLLYSPRFAMTLGRKMDLPTVHRAEDKCRSLAVARRHAANPIDATQGDIVLTGATASPSISHSRTFLPYRARRNHGTPNPEVASRIPFALAVFLRLRASSHFLPAASSRFRLPSGPTAIDGPRA